MPHPHPGQLRFCITSLLGSFRCRTDDSSMTLTFISTKRRGVEPFVNLLREALGSVQGMKIYLRHKRQEISF